MLTADFDYELPPELIAQHPPPERSGGRMLVVDRRGGTLSDSRVRDLPKHLRSGDCLVVNNSRVLAARLLGTRGSNTEDSKIRAAEILVLEPHDACKGLWRALVRPGRKLPDGARVEVGGAEVVVLGRAADGQRIVEFRGLDEAGVSRLLERHGHVPLPPYIRRDDSVADRERYQTVYARAVGSVAAPTAGLHFDAALLAAVRERGVDVTELTLHVGLGTFRPVTEERVERHRMHAERFELSARAADAIAKARRTVAVGTTCVRALETVARNGGKPQCGETNLFIVPGFQFRAVDTLLTNFHLPRSTLLMLVAAFGGLDLVREAYAHAVRERYRFYSYGDCMLIV